MIYCSYMLCFTLSHLKSILCHHLLCCLMFFFVSCRFAACLCGLSISWSLFLTHVAVNFTTWCSFDIISMQLCLSNSPSSPPPSFASFDHDFPSTTFPVPSLIHCLCQSFLYLSLPIVLCVCLYFLFIFTPRCFLSFSVYRVCVCVCVLFPLCARVTSSFTRCTLHPSYTLIYTQEHTLTHQH